MRRLIRVFMILLGIMPAITVYAAAEAPPAFELVEPLRMGAAEITIRMDRDFRKLSVNLFSGTESLIRDAGAEEDILRLDLKRTLEEGEEITFFAEGTGEDGVSFRTERCCPVSAYGNIQWQTEPLLDHMKTCGMLGEGMTLRVPHSLDRLGDISFLVSCAPVLRYADVNKTSVEYAENDSPEWTLQAVYADGSIRNPEQDEQNRYSLLAAKTDGNAERISVWISATLPMEDQPYLQYYYDPETLEMIRMILTVRRDWGKQIQTNLVIHPGREEPYNISFLTEGALPAELWFDQTGSLCEMIWQGERIRIPSESGMDSANTFEGVEWLW